MGSSQQFLHSMGAALLARGKDTLEAAYKGLAAVGQDIGHEVSHELGFGTGPHASESPSPGETSPEASPRESSGDGESLSGESQGSGPCPGSGYLPASASGSGSDSGHGSGSGSFWGNSGDHGVSAAVGRESRGGGGGSESEDSAWGMDGPDAPSREGSFEGDPVHVEMAEGEEGEFPEGAVERAKGHLAALTAELSANKADLAEAYAMLAKAGFDWAQEQHEKARLQEQVAGLTAALEALQATGNARAQGDARGAAEEGGLRSGAAGRGEEKEAEVVRLRRELDEERALRARERLQGQSAEAVIVGALKWVTQVKEEVERERKELAAKSADLDAAREALNRERQELQLADSWREYNVRVKLLEAQTELGVRVAALEELESALAHHLHCGASGGDATGLGSLTLTPAALFPPATRETLRRLLAPFHAASTGTGSRSPAPSPFDVIYGPEGATPPCPEAPQAQQPEEVQHATGEAGSPPRSLREQLEAEEALNGGRSRGTATWEGPALGVPQGLPGQVPGASVFSAPWGEGTHECGDGGMASAHGVPGEDAAHLEQQGYAVGAGGVFSPLVELPGSSPSSDGESGSLSSPRSPRTRGLYGSSSSSSDGFGAGLQQPPVCFSSIQAYVGPLLGSPEGGEGAQSIWDFVRGAAKAGEAEGCGRVERLGGNGADGWRSEAKRQLPALHDGRAAKMRGSSRGSAQPSVGR